MPNNNTYAFSAGSDETQAAPRTATLPVEKPRLYGLSDLALELEDDVARRKDAIDNGRYLGPVSAFPKLDEALSGCFAVGTHAVHGSPGVGKTAFALQIAATCGCPALFVTCEMPPLELVRRHTARATRTYLGRFKDGKMLPEKARELVGRAAAASPQLFLLDGTRAPVKPAFILEAAETVRASDPGNPHLMVVVDSLHSWADAYGQGEETERISTACAALRELSAVLNCPVLFISERNRASMGKGGQNSGASSRKIEYGAETIIGLDATKTNADGCPEYDIVDETTPVKLSISKNRHGEVGRPISLKFHGGFQTWMEEA